ncbi:MAG TPA: hypothetical protein VFV23_07755 [Verrucomicrobiae bacterium]|nr:hypothetical protein [Verrucomicrobiae bacterium]
MKIKSIHTTEYRRKHAGKIGALLGVAVAGALLAQTASAGSIFVIAMENHNFTQPNPTNNPQQILGNPAAPYINSLTTPGNPDAAQVSYALNYYNAGNGVHPSEPSYVWAEAGSDFGAHTDADPRAANNNTFYDSSINLVNQLTANGSTLGFWHFNVTPHLTAQMNRAGVSWKNYQEDMQLSVSPTNSASGTNGPINPFYGTTQYNYAVKHNPMAFFSETALQNVYPLAQLFTDMANDTVGAYNWITPNQYNDAHSVLNGGFTYNGTHYTGDQAAIAQGDNFLSQIIPQIMASDAYRDNGMIIIWWDESEGGDNTNFTVPEFVISPLAKGNAYASTVPMNHSSDIKTMEEIFGLPFINNPIPATETNSFGGYNNVAIVNDLSDLFAPGTIPAPANISVTSVSLKFDPHSNLYSQEVHLKNNGSNPVLAPVFLALDNLSTNAKLVNADGTTAILSPLDSPYVRVNLGGDSVLRPHEGKTVKLLFSNTGGSITYDARVLNVAPAP